MAQVKDIVIIYLEDTPVSFARIESILPDAKKNWYHVKLLILNIPLQTITWILKDDYINGKEFHMNGQKMKLEKVECPGDDLSVKKPENNRVQKNITHGKAPKKTAAKIISFSDFKKNEPDPG